MKKLLLIVFSLVFVYANSDYECKSGDLISCLDEILKAPSKIEFCLNTNDYNYKKACANNFTMITKNEDDNKVEKLKDKLCDDYPNVCFEYVMNYRNIARETMKKNLEKACELDFIKACIFVANNFRDNLKYIKKACDAGDYESCVEYEYKKLKAGELEAAEEECLKTNNCQKALEKGSENEQVLTKLCDEKNANACLKYADLNASKYNGKYKIYNLKACEIDSDICMQKAKKVEQFLHFDFDGSLEDMKDYYKIACKNGLDQACEELDRVNSLNKDDYKFNGKVKTIRIEF